MLKNVEYYMSKGQTGNDVKSPDDYFDDYLKNTHIKNGFVLTVLEFSTLNNQMQEMIKVSENLIETIDEEIKLNTTRGTPWVYFGT